MFGKLRRRVDRNELFPPLFGRALVVSPSKTGEGPKSSAKQRLEVLAELLPGDDVRPAEGEGGTPPRR